MLKKPMFLKGSFFFGQSCVMILADETAGIRERPSFVDRFKSVGEFPVNRLPAQLKT